jgi:hypothetical protein
MEKLYTLLLLISLSAIAPNVWAQPPDLPEGACVTPEVEQCQNPDATLLKWSEGTEAWPDEACNPDESFGECDTNSCDQANSWAQNVCENNGFDVGIWTGRKQAGCGPGGPGGPVVGGTGNISMGCFNNLIPCGPIFETECAPTDQTQIEVFCCNIGEAPPPTVSQIPTLSELGLAVMAAVLGIAGYMVFKRRKQTA